MRILMTTDTVGGVWTFTAELARQLLSRGHAVALASFGREPSEEQQAWQRFFDVIPVACLVTDAHGLILAANRAAALFLNVSVLRLRNQTLAHYIIDRESLIDVLEHQIVEKSQVHASFKVRPREKAIKEIEANVVADPGRSAGTWIWFMMPVERAREVREMTSSGLPSSHLPEVHAEAQG